MQKRKFEELECHELERMQFNAFKVCNELASKMNGTPILNGFMKSKTSFPKSKLFFNNKGYLKNVHNSNSSKTDFIPSYHYFLTLQNFTNKHFKVGKKYLEFLQSPCVDTCEQCPKPTFISPKCHQIPKLMNEKK